MKCTTMDIWRIKYTLQGFKTICAETSGKQLPFEPTQSTDWSEMHPVEWEQFHCMTWWFNQLALETSVTSSLFTKHELKPIHPFIEDSLCVLFQIKHFAWLKLNRKVMQLQIQWGEGCEAYLFGASTQYHVWQYVLQPNIGEANFLPLAWASKSQLTNYANFKHLPNMKQ